MTALPTLGGKKLSAVSINRRGQIAVGCGRGHGGQLAVWRLTLSGFEAVVWGPGRRGESRSCGRFPATRSEPAVWINDKGPGRRRDRVRVGTHNFLLWWADHAPCFGKMVRS